MDMYWTLDQKVIRAFKIQRLVRLILAFVFGTWGIKCNNLPASRKILSDLLTPLQIASQDSQHSNPQPFILLMVQKSQTTWDV